MRVLLAQNPCKVALLTIVLSMVASVARAEWTRDNKTLAWRDTAGVVWQFTFDPRYGKPFFNPLAAPGGPDLTNFKPEDHPWHYGLWFSWKYINGANYWEEDRQTGRAEGATRWSAPLIETQDDGAAVIRMALTYTHPSGRLDMTEEREIRVSAPAADGGYAITWRSRFVAGPEGALLDRTPMPDEPKGQVNGGYAGLSVRLAGPPLEASFLSSEGLVDHFVSDRARPNAGALACDFTRDGRDSGGVAVFSDPANAGENPPWYVVNSKQMRFFCAAILAPKPLMIAPGGHLELKYRIGVSPRAWTVETLQGGVTADR
jgi:hypothetical protein